MMLVVKFRLEHIAMIEAQDSQRDQIDPDNYKLLSMSGPCHTVIENDKVMLAGGLSKIWDGRYLLWSLVSKHAGAKMLAYTRGVRRFLELHDCPRVEMIVRSSFEAGHRWAHMLGFNWHHHEERFLPDGSDGDIYVRFKNG